MNKLIVVVNIFVMAMAPPVAANRDAVITIQPQSVIGKVNPLIFGNNQIAYPGLENYSNRGAGIWSPERLSPVPKYVAISKLAGITVQRWPGGCIAHNYNWKMTVGSLKKRPNMKFGLPEFLAFCEATNAIPLITLAVFWGEPRDAADIVEYLNKPNDSSNPNGGTDWAAIRSDDGHPEPYGVIWFEYGNETYHGEHKTKKNPNPRHISPEEYAYRYLKYQAAMKALDPRIKLGGVLQNGRWEWNRKVLERCGKQMDFAIDHTYDPKYSNNDDIIPRSLLMKACTASDAKIQNIYAQLLTQIKEVTGRDDVQLAITEYNGHFNQEKPVPYRQSLANALRNAEHLRVMMRPENRILMANFWQFANEYWGMVQGYMHQGQKPLRQANFFPYQLYHEHFGESLIKADVQCAKWDFLGAASIPARKGEPSKFKLWEENLLPKNYIWNANVKSFGSVNPRIEGKIVVVEFQGADVNFYNPHIRLAVEPSTGYRVIGYIKTEELIDQQGVGFEVLDARGWNATNSSKMKGEVKGTSDWTKVQIDYLTLNDATAIEIRARRLGGGGPINGIAYFKLESVQKYQPANTGAVPDLGVNTAKRIDGSITLMIVNKNIEDSVPVYLKIEGDKPRENAARAWLLTGPSPFANNLKDSNNIGINETTVSISNDSYYLKMPPHSMAAIEIKPK